MGFVKFHPEFLLKSFLFYLAAGGFRPNIKRPAHNPPRYSATRMKRTVRADACDLGAIEFEFDTAAVARPISYNRAITDFPSV